MREQQADKTNQNAELGVEGNRPVRTTPDAYREVAASLPADVAMLEADLALCRRELAQVRERQEEWMEQASLLPMLRNERDELARLLARQLSAAYWAGSRPSQVMPGGMRGRIAKFVLELDGSLGRRQRLQEEWRRIEMIEKSPYFDGGWYLGEYPDVANSGFSPAEHYLRHGATEGRNPGPNFSTEFYMRNNPDVVRSGDNPLMHFMLFGECEGRLPAPARSR